MDQVAIIKRYMQGKVGSGAGLSSETISGCAAFARAYRELIHPLPVDSVQILVAYEQYQDMLAEEAAGIDWLDRDRTRELKETLAGTVLDSEGIIGCDREAAVDSMVLWTRGMLNRMKV